MKSVLRILVLTLLYSLSGFAQVSSIEVGNTFQVFSGEWHLVLKNQSTSSLVAYWISFHCPKTGTIDDADALLYNGNRYIHSGESFEVKAGDPSKCSGSVDAAIFSDGHAEGDSNTLDILYSRRRGAYKALSESIPLLNALQTGVQPVQQVAGAIHDKRQSNRNEKSVTAAGYDLIVMDIERALTDSHWAYPPVPSQIMGEQARKIEDVMTANGVSHDEARVVVLNERFGMWKSALENNLHPSSKR